MINFRIFIVFLISIVFSTTVTVAAINCDSPEVSVMPQRFEGYARYGGSVLTTQTVVATLAGRTFSDTTDSGGWYTLDISRCSNETDNSVTFTVCTRTATETSTFSSGGDFVTLNLTISSACPVEEAAAAAGGGGGGGGGGVAAAPTSESQTVTSIGAGETKTISYNKPDIHNIISITITAVNAVSNVKITITKTSKPVGAPDPISNATGGVYGYISIAKTNIADEDIKSVKIKFRVEKSWFTNNNYGRNTVALQRYSAGTWTKLPAALVDADDVYYYYEVELDSLSTFAITAEKITKLTAFDIINIIKDYYAGVSTYTAFEIIDIIKNFYAGG